MDRNLKAIGFIVGGLAIVGFIDNFVRLIAGDMSLWQFHFLRGAIAVPLLCAVGIMAGWRLKPIRLGHVLARNMFLSGAMFVYFGCLGFFPMAQVAAGLFTSPILVMLITALWTRTAIGPVRIVAAVVGFIGTLMVLQPAVGGLGWANLIPIVAGLLYAISNVVTRRWCEGESAFALLWSYMAIMCICSAAVVLWLWVFPLGGDDFLTRDWVWPSPFLWGLIVMQAALSLIGIGMIMQAYLMGDATYVTVFEYSFLLSAGLTAYLLFGEVTPPLGLAGVALIMVTGGIIVLRSARTGQM